MDSGEYKHVVLGLIFLKYISDTFEEHRAKLLSGEGDYAGANPEDPDEYKAENVFWVPVEGRWSHLQANAKQPVIGKLVDDAMVAIERDNPRLKGVLPKDYARPTLGTNTGWVNSSISSAPSASATAKTAPRTSSGASMNTSSAASPVRRASEAASSTPRSAWTSCWCS